MRLIAARITNFRSFKKTQKFVFPQTPGLYFMEGINESEPRLEANGAGKSSIWEAVTWCLHGKTSRGLKAGDVSNWEAGKGTRVEIDFEMEAGMCTLVRAWGPIKHYVQFANGDQKQDITKDDFVLGWLGLQFQPYLNCILLAQGEDMFLDLKPTAQAELFAAVMGLDQWLDYSTRASKQAAAADDDARRQEALVARAEGRLEAAAAQDHQRLYDAWETKRAERLQTLTLSYEQMLNHSTAKEDAEAANAAAERARKHLQSCRVPADLKAAYQDALVKVTDVRMLLKIEERARDEADARLQMAESGEACPTCGVMPKRAEHQEHVRRAMKEFKRLDDLGRSLAAQYDDVQAAVKAVSAELSEAEAVEHNARDHLADAEDEAARCARAVAQENKQLDAMEDEAEDIEAEINPHAESLQRQARDEKRMREEIRDLEAELDETRRRQGLTSYWVKGFKELRLNLIAEALTELEIEVNSSCEALGLVGWELRFQVDRETKGGGVSRGFSVLVQAPGVDKPTPWEAWSGGEGQRLRLATQMGLADLIRARTGATLPLEVWDEPTSDLSAQGVQDLLECLVERAQLEQRCIWLVDHRTREFGAFAGGATIIKTPSGSRIRQR